MLTKTFREKDMVSALNSVKKELGPDAIIVSMREVPSGPAWQVWKETDYEVIASIDKVSDHVKKQPRSESTDRNDRKKRTVERKNKDNKSGLDKNKVLIDTKVNIDEVIEPPQLRPESTEKTVLGKMRLRLLNQGLNEHLVNRLIMTSCQALSTKSQENISIVQDHLKSQLEVFIHTGDNSILDSTRLIIFLVGTHGSGKTSACAKLAYDSYINQGKKVTWICADTLKTGAITEANKFTEPLNIPLKVVYTPQTLKQVIEEDKESDLVLIDMPGCNPLNEASMKEIEEYLNIIDQKIIYLVISATTKEFDLDQTYAAFSKFNINGYVVTKIDETLTFGNVFNFAWKSRKPIVYFSTGSNVIENFEPAKRKIFINMLVGERNSK